MPNAQQGVKNNNGAKWKMKQFYKKIANLQVDN